MAWCETELILYRIAPLRKADQTRCSNRFMILALRKQHRLDVEDCTRSLQRWVQVRNAFPLIGHFLV